jgi:L-alanine-DL-glutamate epimerase-like enolase superfamily enzyme
LGDYGTSINKVTKMHANLWRQDAEIRFPVSAAEQRHDLRSRLYVRVEHDGIAGYGECAPQPVELNGDAGLLDVVDELRIFVLPQLRQIIEREGAAPSWTRVARFAGSRAASNPAVALLEMALLDRELRAEERSIASLWPPRYDTPLQSTVSLLDDDEWSVVVDVARVRVKTSSARPSTGALARLAALNRPVLLDFNCGAENDAQVLEQVRMVSDVADLVCVEQPYAVGNVVDMARLAEQLSVPLSVDEGVRSVRDLAQIVRYQAAGIVCVKPARVGGLANARTIIGEAREAGLRPYLGGFFESPFGRRVNAHLAHHCVDEPSDLSPVPVVLDGFDRETDEVAYGFGVAPSAAMLAAATPVQLDL